MNKRIICRTATILCGLLAIIIHTRPDTMAGHAPNSKLIEHSLGLLSAIFATQWAAYQKQYNPASAQPGWSGWVRRLLFSSVSYLVLSPFSMAK